MPSPDEFGHWGGGSEGSPPAQEPDKPDTRGWLGGLIKPEPEPLPARTPEADSFSTSGQWLAGKPLIWDPEAEEARRAARRVKKQKELPTGEVALDDMLAKARLVEEKLAGAKLSKEVAPPTEPTALPVTSAARSIPPPASASQRPAWAKPETLEDPPPPAWVQRLEPAPAAGPSGPPGPPDPPLIPKAPAKPAQIDRVVTSIPKRSLMQAWSANVQRQRVSFYRALTTMLGAGLPMFSVFDFMARQAESEEQRDACRRISRDLVSGYPLHKAAFKEPYLFSEIAVKLIEIGMRSGKLVAVLQRLAADEEDRWKLRQTLQSHLLYPVCIASLTLVAVVLLPPFVLADLLTQVVQLTSEPPALTKAILWFSTSLSSPGFLSFVALVGAALAVALNSHAVRQKILSLEPLAWEIPGLGELIRSAVSLRFLRVFAMTYEVGLTAPQCLVLAAEATGSRKAMAAGPRMKGVLIEGGTLRESLDIGDFLPHLVVESMEAAQQSGDVSGMMENVARIVDSELEYRIENLMALIEPLFMAVLGIFVGVFAVGCLLPILKLSESL